MMPKKDPPQPAIGRMEAEVRIDAAREAQIRGRWALLAATVVSLAILITQWNSYLSWDRRFLKEEDKDFVKKSKVSQHLHYEEVAGWNRMTRINVPLLGVAYSVSDAPVLGSLTLMILTVWLFFAMRRENHVIATTLSEMWDHPNWRLQRTVFFGITGRLVFNTLSAGDEPLGALPICHMGRGQRANVPRAIVSLMFHFPGIASVLIILADLGSLFLKSVIRRPGVAVYDSAQADMPRFFVTILVAVVFATFTVTMCNRIKAFNDATRDILLQFEKEQVLKPR